MIDFNLDEYNVTNYDEFLGC